MATMLKRSLGVTPPECIYGCCTQLYGKHVPHVRRSAKRREKQQFNRDLRNNTY